MNFISNTQIAGFTSPPFSLNIRFTPISFLYSEQYIMTWWDDVFIFYFLGG